ncbi:MAG: hypothetical protein JO327_11700 [Nitrososphaeraceae archaeon]|nr:hypothetical protein [Nitrososphaeraceae archaeon]MBV9668779.1 hypothetical protein [Nitrososphaeraceae archaeon]
MQEGNDYNSNRMITIGWTRGNKKALATMLPTKYWENLKALSKFHYADIAAR